MRSRAWLVAAVMVMAVPMSPVLENVSAQSTSVPGIVISELRFSGPTGASDEFIELFNASSAAIQIGGWQVRVSGNQSTANALRTTIPTNEKSLVGPGCYYLITFTPGLSGYSGSVAGDHTYGTGFGDEGGVAVGPSTTDLKDMVGFHSGTLYKEGTAISGGFSTLNRSFERLPGGGHGHVDTNNNAADFQLIVESTPQVTHVPNPQNSASPCVETVEISVKPHHVQGSGAMSPMVGVVTTVQGVVTARAVDGFFIQTAVNEDDLDPQTSEGLFVFTAGPAPAAAQVGHLVNVTGTVVEFRPDSDPSSAPRTQLSNVTSVVDNGTAPLPDAYELTSDDLAATGSLDQLEHLEGMRLTAPSLTAVSGTASDGVFYAVLTEQLATQLRPFREPGVEAGYPVLPCSSGDCNVPLFDGNPERLRVDSDGLEGVGAAHVSSGAVMTNVTGPLDFGSRTYTLLPEATLAPAGGMALVNAPVAPASLYTVASFNATRFGDVSEAVWATKASLALRSSMNLPDVVALQGVDHASLQSLADHVNAGDPSPGYQPVFVAGSDVAFLVGSRVSAATPEVVGAADTFDRPSLLLRATVNGPTTSLPQAVTLLANHLEPVNGVLARRQAQAEFLADYVRGLQLNNEAFVVLGDFNAFSFNDGYVDTVGTVLGSPAPPDQVALASLDVVEPNLVDVTAMLADQDKYSFVLNGNAQTHEHVLVSASLAPQHAGVSRPRVNGDFPDVWRLDDSTPARVSAKDPVVAYFTFPPDVDAPVIDPAEDVLAEATGPDGAAVTFATPEATDNLDEVVVVTCAPVSGSVFPLGNSGVTCSATDAAGNAAEDVGFTVTVQDTTAPVITVPGDISEEATSPDGRAVTFTATATDAVSGSPAVSCSPASGSNFPIGTTEVYCMASDAAGNVGEASFSVTVTVPVPGRMHGGGTVGSGQQRVAFTFDVGESTNFVERGWLMVLARDGAGRPRSFAGKVDEVSFSNDEGYEPGQVPASGVDTVTFSGVGWWNGHPGYHFQVTASDRGEPGVGMDTFALVVTSPAGEVVESASGVLRGGNIQSLR
ncbi:MAG: HYR domain-containing protein [Vicinamibacterales bacterium]